ncbi:ABC transporter substrate-binding protein [Ruegeria pomeroyi]|uniref:Branched-chain amino acid ABC transporter, periplasmic branched-chain amino acid binding protein n=2 Tax=Ruegeria pomeroyi TaxID=89184 RepID=Q5LSD8_RUEPO|nr:ABC transporter substrate-binding protein [Ruegeria pomeroyi]HCE70567.1 amino acid ABC transporter substrate-binding protein [Ruegeria sp.]AAV95109.1 branched-chain amino acid ABC transporter, periplasmic branched-chain amino acid binding protein [Ruegeria pomeroyi DSS-3]NVK99142.1 ABC transporter substrate-binding protein [Ruegeria pomeroyi]NVL00806.1 ABC transporter substrate-binding protein [Ruegeria pomeroyi]QWV08683.1 ABC transporter substrate-binding protein [Ruegeria pomeroyi]
MRKTSIAALACVALASPALAADTIKIGLGVPMTGDYAPYSEWQGARCMADMINAKGGVNGMKIEVLIQDSGADTQTAISLAQKFLDEGAVMLGTIPFSDTMIPVAQVAQGYGVSIFQPQSTQVEMHAGIVDNFFTGVSPDPFTATAAANHALSLGVKNVVLMTSDEGGSWSARTPLWFGDVVEAGGGKVLSKLNFSFGTSDWSPQIAEMKALGEQIDAVYISSIMPDIAVLIRQMRSAGIEAYVVGSDGFDDPSLDAIGTDDPAILDKVFFATLAPSHADSAVVRFIAECKEMGIDVPGLFPATGADTVKAVAWAVEQSGSTDPATLAETLRNADSIPVMSVDAISFKETRTYAQRTIPVIGFEGGKRVLISNEIPANTPTDWN